MPREKEDDDQYRELLRLRYPDRDIEELCDRIIERRNRIDLLKIEAEEIYATQLRHGSPSNLATILFPMDKKLSSVPFYKRYAAYLVSEYGYKRTCSLLYLSRTSLWRLLSDESDVN